MEAFNQSDKTTLTICVILIIFSVLWLSYRIINLQTKYSTICAEKEAMDREYCNATNKLVENTDKKIDNLQCEISKLQDELKRKDEIINDKEERIIGQKNMLTKTRVLIKCVIDTNNIRCDSLKLYLRSIISPIFIAKDNEAKLNKYLADKKLNYIVIDKVLTEKIQ